MHKTQTDYANAKARHEAAVKLFTAMTAHLAYPDDVESPEWEWTFNAEEVIREECKLFTLGELRTESEDRLIAWSLDVARKTAQGNPEGLNSITFLESNAWRPSLRKELLGIATRLTPR